jgi:hypothetical protein
MLLKIGTIDARLYLHSVEVTIYFCDFCGLHIGAVFLHDHSLQKKCNLMINFSYLFLEGFVF